MHCFPDVYSQAINYGPTSANKSIKLALNLKSVYWRVIPAM